MKQLNWTDIYHEYIQPEFPDCWKTCIHFDNSLSDGHLDYFMDWAKDQPDLNHPRCVRYVGKPKLVDNVWQMHCKLYEAEQR